MVPSPGTCEIIEAEETDPVPRLKETHLRSSGSFAREKSSQPSIKGYKYSLEDDLNQLFEAIDLRISTRGLGWSHQSGADSSQKAASKRPIRGGVSQASCIGISESVSLKQALRKLSISHASEMAATKRLAKSVGTPGVSEAGTIKRLYRAVVVEATESGLHQDERNGSVVEVSLVPENSARNTTEKISDSSEAPDEKSLASTTHFETPTELSLNKLPPQDSMVPLPADAGKGISTVKLEQEVNLESTQSLSSSNTSIKPLEIDEGVSASLEDGSRISTLDREINTKPHCSLSLSSSDTGTKVSKPAANSSSLLKPVFKNNCFSKKKAKHKVSTICSSANACTDEDKSGTGPSTSKPASQSHDRNQKVRKVSSKDISAGVTFQICSSNTDSIANKPGFSPSKCSIKLIKAKRNETSSSREKGESSQSSKSSIGECSSGTSGEETNSNGSSYNSNRPHMSKDLRWDAIQSVEEQHGKVGLRHFKLLKRLGCGDIGTVYLAELTGTNCLFAVKIMDTEFLTSRKKMPRALSERDILQMLDHPFLPTLFAHFTTEKFLCLVMEYCPGGDLHVLRQRQPGGRFTEEAARFYVAEVLLALEYLHMLGVVYRDLKPENILVREDGHIMLSDFDLSLRCTVRPTLLKMSSSVIETNRKTPGPCIGTSCIHPFCLQPSFATVPCFTPRLISTAEKTRKVKPASRAQVPQLVAEPTSARSNSFVGTHEYLAPEIIKGEGHGNAVDWWTFGIFLYELLFGKTPFKGLGNEETLVNIVLHSLKLPMNPSVSSQAKDLIRCLLTKDPENRLGSAKGAAEIRRHPFFGGLNWALIRCAVPPMLPKSCDPGSLLVSTNKPIEFQSSGEEKTEFEQF